MATHPKKPQENTEWQVSAVSDVTVNIKDEGTDTATARYLGMDSSAISLILRTNETITIEEINGFTLKEPMTISANNSWVVSRRSRFRVENFKINVLTHPTRLKLFALTTGRRGVLDG
jgi:hypothetical protein